MRQILRQLTEQLGWQGMSGLALLVLAGMLNFMTLRPVTQEVEYMRARLDAAKSNTGTQARTFSSGNRQEELRMFFDSLPAEQDVTDILASISTVAEASGVELRQAEYRLDDKNKSRLEYQLYYPVQGGYSNIRHFVFRVLSEHPAIALDQVNFHRDRVGDPLLNADIRLTLFLQPT